LIRLFQRLVMRSLSVDGIKAGLCRWRTSGRRSVLATPATHNTAKPPSQIVRD
jgi:hypothetical protein